MDLDPIKQLQSLLDDRNKVLEKISSIHSVLGSLKPTGAAAPELTAPIGATAAAQGSADFVYGRLQRALHDMQTQIEQRVQPIARQVVESEIARLRQQSGYDQAALTECLARLDRCILNFVDGMDEYHERYSVLTGINQRLASLGAPTEPMPESPSARALSDSIPSPVERLPHQIKL